MGAPDGDCIFLPDPICFGVSVQMLKAKRYSGAGLACWPGPFVCLSQIVL